MISHSAKIPNSEKMELTKKKKKEKVPLELTLMSVSVN